ncbi:FHA domain-containing protein [Rhodobacterales bacterium HKCCE2091]|nr:FHA domain-containing protein [Rhodobacterales bacterium HKCCE2091]
MTAPLAAGVAPARLEFGGGQPDVALAEGRNQLGRLAPPENTVMIPDGNVARKHVEIGVEPDGSAWIENLTVQANSDSLAVNPVFVNDTEITQVTRLASGDEIRLGSTGDTRFRFVTGGRS